MISTQRITEDKADHVTEDEQSYSHCPECSSRPGSPAHSSVSPGAQGEGSRLPTYPDLLSAVLHSPTQVRPCQWKSIHLGAEGQVVHYFCCFSVIKSCPVLCIPMDSSTPGSPVLHYLSEFSRLCSNECPLSW